MKNASRGLSLAAVIVSSVSLTAALTHMIFALSSRWMAVAVLVFALGMLPVSIVLRCHLRKETHSRWIGLICVAIIAGLFFVSDTLAEILLKNQAAATMENPLWVSLVMVYSFLSALASFALTLTASLLDAIDSISEIRDNKNPLRLFTKIFWSDIIVGILWSLAGIAGFAPKNTFTFLVANFSRLGAIIIISIMRRIRSEQFDEMAEANYRHAKAKTLDIMCCIIAGSYVVFLLLEMIFTNIPLISNPGDLHTSDYLYNFIWFFLGLQSIIKGIIFRKLEAS